MYILGLCSSCGTCMVPFWASADSGSVPIWGSRPKPRCTEEVVYILNDSCSHFTNVFSLREFHQHSQTTSYCAYNTYIEYHSYLLYITFIRIFTSLYTCLVHNFISSDLPGRLAAHGFLCLLQYQLHQGSGISASLVWICCLQGNSIFVSNKV